MEMNVGWPEGIYLALNIIALALIGGTPPEDRKPIKPVPATVFWLGITLPLLYWGGFFS